eukprot:gene15292-5979_t
MTGWNGLTQVEHAIENIGRSGVPGDVIETGGRRGG